jgi:NADH-quinone oxidoreductase subunit E
MNRDIILSQYEPVNHNMLLILHHLQDANPNHYLEMEDLDGVARYLNTTRAAVYGVVRYYSMFSLEPRGKYIIRCCVSPVCRMMGGIDMLHQLKKILNLDMGQTGADGLFTLEHSECLGHCDKAPALMVNEEVHGQLTLPRLQQLIDELKAAGMQEMEQ